LHPQKSNAPSFFSTQRSFLVGQEVKQAVVSLLEAWRFSTFRKPEGHLIGTSCLFSAKTPSSTSYIFNTPNGSPGDVTG
jgi:hypothetical protein